MIWPVGVARGADNDDDCAMRTHLLAAASISVLASAGHAQSAIPERTLGAPTVVDSEPFRNVASIRELSDGRVIVVERGPLNALMQGMMSEMIRRVAPAGRGGRATTADSNAKAAPAAMSATPDPGAPPRVARVVMLDRALAHATPIGRAGTEPGNYIQPAALFAGSGDTTMLIDEGASDIFVIGPSGALTRTKSNPGVQGAMMAIAGAAIDRAGRLLYQPRQQISRTTPAGVEVATPDSAAITAYDFKTGGSIPVAEVRVVPSVGIMERDTTQRGGMHMVTKAFPFPTIDDWVMMPDGTLAIIRGADLHIDWIGPNGRKRSTPPIPYVKVAVSDSDKVRLITTIHRLEGAIPMMPAGMSLTQADPDSFPHFKPPFATRGARAASDGTIWLPARTISPDSADGFYVVGPDGRVREHVHLMKGQRLLGFGKGVIYVAVNKGPQDNRVARVPLR